MTATATRKPAHVAASVQDLLALWHGDPDLDGDDTHHVLGYHHPGLVTAVCELIQPGHVLAVRSRFYPKLTDKGIPEEAGRMIKAGYEDWKAKA